MSRYLLAASGLVAVGLIGSYSHAQTADFCVPVPDPGITCIGDVQKDGPGPDFGELVWIGRDADGAVIVGDGGSITLGPGVVDEANPSLTVGRGGNTGDLTVTGTGEFRMDGDDTGAFVVVGDDPGTTGTMNIIDGGSFTMSDTNVTFDGVINRDVYIDLGNSGGEGTLFMDTGSLLLESNSTSGLSIGSAGNGVGTARVTNGSTLTLTTTGDRNNKGDAQIRVGRSDGGGNNNGTLEVIDSSVLIEAPNGDARFRVGEFQSVGTALISGPTTTFTLDGFASEMRIGSGVGAVGRATLEDGASVVVGGSDSSIVAVGSRNDAVGRLDILSGASLHVVGPEAIMDIGDPNAIVGETSSGIVNVSGAGSLLKTDTDILVGRVNGNGSTTGILNVSDGATIETPFLNIADGGFLGGNGGTVIASLVELQTGGTIGPGLSPGILTIDGDLGINGGTLEIEVEGNSPGEFDILNVLGNVNANGIFDLVLSFSGFAPDVDEVIPFLQVAGTVDDSFLSNAQVSVIGLGSNGAFSLVQTSRGLGVRADVVAAIPVPASGLLLAGALVGLASFRRRRPTGTAAA